MALTDEDVARILKIIDESGYDEVKLEYGDLKIYVRRYGAADAPALDGRSAVISGESASSSIAATQPSTMPVAVSDPGLPAGPAVDAIPEGLVAVRAPMLGTFYRASSPGAGPFVEVGASVQSDDTVCLIEVMKLFNSLKAGVAGRVVKFLVENGAMVEHGQVLLLIDPQATV